MFICHKCNYFIDSNVYMCCDKQFCSETCRQYYIDTDKDFNNIVSYYYHNNNKIYKKQKSFNSLVSLNNNSNINYYRKPISICKSYKHLFSLYNAYIFLRTYLY